ncbi:MAG: DUF11 domain-containing protein [Anaerolineales bacterium]|nr:DUF11 domain-containing protein [Anaerolineales bacterium]
MTATIGLLSPPRATARPAAQGEDLSVVKTVQTDADPINGAIIYNGDRITYTLTIRNLTGSPLAVDKAEDTLVSGTFFGVECIAGTPGIACEVNKTVTQVSIPALRKGAANTDTVIETANGVIWRNFTINPGQTTILRFKARVDCRAANSLIFNDAAVTYGGVSFIPSNQTQTTVQLKTSVLNAEGAPLWKGRAAALPKPVVTTRTGVIMTRTVILTWPWQQPIKL